MLEHIIRLLKGNSHVSGTGLARELGITRAGIWKRVNALKDKGFDIEAQRGRGYRLLSAPDFSVEELKTLIKGQIGKEIIYFKEIDSTNDFAMKLAQDKASHGTVVIADTQTRGKGRLGRKWLSPEGSNIYMSIILKPSLALSQATLLTILSSVSVASALRGLTGLDINIKWPNDIMVKDKKLGGILLEIKSEPDKILFAVIGIGINVNMPTALLPEDIKAVSTSILEETGRKYKRTLLIAEILNETDKGLNILKKHGDAQILSKWKGLSSTLGRNVMVTIGKETIKGIAEDIDDEGRLILKTKDGKRKVISSGDLRMLR